MSEQDILEKDELIQRLRRMGGRKGEHGDIFDFEFYLAMTFASDKLMNEVASLVVNIKDQAAFEVAFARKMYVFQDRFRNAPAQMRRSVAHHLGSGVKLESFSDAGNCLMLLHKQ